MDTSDLRETIKVKPWGKDQGEFVEINAEDFDPAIHSPFGAKSADQPAPVAKPRPKAKAKP